MDSEARSLSALLAEAAMHDYLVTADRLDALRQRLDRDKMSVGEWNSLIAAATYLRLEAARCNTRLSPPPAEETERVAIIKFLLDMTLLPLPPNSDDALAWAAKQIRDGEHLVELTAARAALAAMSSERAKALEEALVRAAYDEGFNNGADVEQGVSAAPAWEKTRACAAIRNLKRENPCPTL